MIKIANLCNSVLAGKKEKKSSWKLIEFDCTEITNGFDSITLHKALRGIGLQNGTGN